MTEQLPLTHSIEDDLNSTVLYNFIFFFNFMISYNPIITPLFNASSPSRSLLISSSLFFRLLALEGKKWSYSAPHPPNAA